MQDEARPPPTHLFTLRLWSEQTEANKPIWRGQVQHTVSGEVRYFQGWPALKEALRLLMDDEI